MPVKYDIDPEDLSSDLFRSGARMGGLGTASGIGGWAAKNDRIGYKERLPDDNEGDDGQNRAIIQNNTSVSVGRKNPIRGTDKSTLPTIPDLSKPPSLVISEAPIYQSTRPDESGRDGWSVPEIIIFRKPPAILQKPPTYETKRGGPNPIGDSPVLGPPIPPGPVRACPC